MCITAARCVGIHLGGGEFSVRLVRGKRKSTFHDQKLRTVPPRKCDTLQYLDHRLHDLSDAVIVFEALDPKAVVAACC